MKRVYFVAIFAVFVLLVVISFNLPTAQLTSSAVLGEDEAADSKSPGESPEFSSFGLVSAIIMVLLSFIFIKNIKKEE
jgi:hypothetical protein